MPTRFTPARSRLFIALALAAGSVLSAGCAQRSLVAVRESGDYNYKMGHYDAALTDYKEYVERAPGKPEVHQMLGNTYMKLGETGLGREQLLMANAMRVEDDQIFADMCAALYTDKQYDDLNRVLRQRTVDRGRMQDWALLATYSEKLGDRDEAQRAWLTAAKVSNGRAVDPQIGLARLYMQVGDMDRSRQCTAMAYWLEPGNPNVQILVRDVKEVPGPTLGVMPSEFSGPLPPHRQPMDGRTVVVPTAGDR